MFVFVLLQFVLEICEELYVQQVAFSQDYRVLRVGLGSGGVLDYFETGLVLHVLDGGLVGDDVGGSWYGELGLVDYIFFEECVVVVSDGHDYFVHE